MDGRYREAVSRLSGGSVCMATVLYGADAGKKLVWRNESLLGASPAMEPFWEQAMGILNMAALPGQFEVLGKRLYAERLVQEPELVICGGGHISQELAALADYLEYPYVVLDDREEFCNRERFPGAANCICEPFSDGLTKHEFSGNAYYIIVTRGHQADMECLERVLRLPHGYVGMIGSRGKVAKTMAALEAKGFSKEERNSVHAPIGLSIGGQTPKEIAVSIVAELIQEKNRENPASYLDQSMIRALLKNESGILVTIIGKRGSAPRGTGSRMIVGRDGILCGTIGGGVVEYEAAKKAGMLMDTWTEKGIAIETYRVNADSAAALGMWCGGEVDVLFERL